MPDSREPAAPGGNHTLRTNDFDELAQAFTAWDATFRQMHGGPFAGTLSGVRVGAVGVSRMTLTHAVLVRGTLRRPGYLFAPVMSANSRALWRGSNLHPGQVNLVGPETHIDHLSTPEADYLMLTIGRDALREIGGIQARLDVEEYLHRRLAFSPTPAIFQRLLTRMQTTLVRSLSPDERTEAEADLVGQLVRSLVSGDPTLEEVPPLHSRQWIARRAEEFMLTNLARPTAILSVCRELDVSERTLQYAFRDRFGMSPKAYLKALRLNAIRRELKAADPRVETVREIARRWGLSHLGDFAASYWRHFGEFPSVTLAG